MSLADLWDDQAIADYLSFCDVCKCPDVSVGITVWANESGCDPTAHNANGNASGLGQLMPDTAKGLGWDVANDPTLAKFRALGVSGQLPWFAKYYGCHAGKIGTVARLYTCTFLPALLDHADQDSFVLCAANGPFRWAYLANKGFDVDAKGYITPLDLANAAHRAAQHPQIQVLLARVRAAAAPTAPYETPIAVALPDVTPDDDMEPQ